MTLSLLLAVPLSIAGSGPGPWASASSPASRPAAEPARYVPVQPCRLLDTRAGGGDALPAGDELRLDVTGGDCAAGAVDAIGSAASEAATAVSIVVTAVEPDAAGFVSAWPAGEPPSPTSVLNYRAGQVVANSQIVRVGADGAVSLSSLAPTHLVVDLMGYFVTAPGPTADGRFVALPPVRVLDTRSGGRPAPGESVRVVTGAPDDAVAVAVNLTTTASSGGGFFTAHAAGTERPTASMLNTDRAGQPRSVFGIVPVAEGAFDVFSSAGDHVIVDVTGYVTGPGAPVSDEGRFIAVDPFRVLDTRGPVGSDGGPRLWDGGARDVDLGAVANPVGGIGGVGAVALNVTMTDTEDGGYVVATPARTGPSATSSVNADAAQRTVANSAIVGVSTAGVRFETLHATELVVDVTGWFTGAPVAGDGPAAVNAPPPDRRVFIIADSTMAGMRWNRTLAGLQGFQAVTDLESCRRLVAPSCRGREGYTPPSLVAELRRLSGVTPEDILVIGAGYDDWLGRFPSDFDTVVAAARAAGFRHIAWANYVVTNNYLQPGSLAPNYAAMNAVLERKVASGEYPEVRIWDLDAYVRDTVGWLYADGIHQRPLGSWGVADWISRHVRAFDDRPCAQPWRPGLPVDDPCPDPDLLPQQIGHPDIVGIYGL